MSPPLRAEFVRSVSDVAQCPLDDRPEVAFCGRSNVGKSSSLNTITGSKNLARVAQRPGHTRLLNLFACGGGRLVDVPGYGYARASKTAIQKWQILTDTYLETRENLRGVVLVMDIRRDASEFDIRMVNWCIAANKDLLVLLNKADKLRHNARLNAYQVIRDELAYIEDPESQIVLFSAKSGLGIEKARECLSDWLGPER